MEDLFSLEQIEQAISQANRGLQQRLLRDLPHLLKIQAADLALLKIAESAFDFWNNPDDVVYDRL